MKCSVARNLVLLRGFLEFRASMTKSLLDTRIRSIAELNLSRFERYDGDNRTTQYDTDLNWAIYRGNIGGNP